jgi:hypothetical protein
LSDGRAVGESVRRAVNEGLWSAAQLNSMLDFPKIESVTSRHISMSNKRILWRRTLSDFGAGDDTDSQVSSVQIVTLR